MACAFESSDNSMIVSPTKDVRQPWHSESLEKEINRIQRMYPQLTQQDLASSQKLLEEQKLLPGFELVASRDADGRVKDGSGRIVLLNRTEMTDYIAESEHSKDVAFEKTVTDAASAFDRFSVGNPNAAPNDLINLARISQPQIQEALKQPGLSAEETAGLNFLNKNFSTLRDNDAFYSNESLSRDALKGLHRSSRSLGEQNLDKYSVEKDYLGDFDSLQGYVGLSYAERRPMRLDDTTLREPKRGDSSRSDVKVRVRDTKKSSMNDETSAANAEIYSVLDFENPNACHVVRY